MFGYFGLGRSKAFVVSYFAMLRVFGRSASMILPDATARCIHVGAPLQQVFVRGAGNAVCHLPVNQHRVRIAKSIELIDSILRESINPQHLFQYLESCQPTPHTAQTTLEHVSHTGCPSPPDPLGLAVVTHGMPREGYDVSRHWTVEYAHTGLLRHAERRV